MADATASHLGFLVAALKGNRGTTVTYSRGSSSVQITATKGNSGVAVTDAEGFFVSNKDQDWLIAAADIPFGTPRRGDQIRQRVGTTVEVHEVLPVDGDSDVYQNRDGRGVIYRVHTKRVDTE